MSSSNIDPEAISPNPITFYSPDDESSPERCLSGILKTLFKAKEGRYGETTFVLIWRGEKPPRIRFLDQSEIRFEQNEGERPKG